MKITANAEITDLKLENGKMTGKVSFDIPDEVLKPPVVVPPPVVIPPVVTPPIGTGISSGFADAIKTAGEGREVIFADGTFSGLGDIVDVPIGVSIRGRVPGLTKIVPARKLGYVSGSDNSDAWLRLSSGTRQNGNQKISNLVIQGDGALGGILVNNRDNVTLENIEVSKCNFFGIWARYAKNFKAKGIKLIDNSWASDSWASGEFCYVELDQFDISEVELISTVQTRGYGFKALWGAYNESGVQKFRNMYSGRFAKIKSNLHHQSAWAAGKSNNIGFEMQSVNLQGNILMEDCNWENQVSLHTATCSPGSMKILRNEWNGENDRYAIEGIICNLEVANCKIKNVSQWMFNGQRNFKVNNWNLHDNEFDQGSAPNTGWGAVLLFGGDGASNVNVRNNKIRKSVGNDLLKFQGTQGGVNADIQTANTITNF